MAGWGLQVCQARELAPGERELSRKVVFRQVPAAQKRSFESSAAIFPDGRPSAGEERKQADVGYETEGGSVGGAGAYSESRSVSAEI